MRQVLFLDIDGVLNSTRSATAFGKYPWSGEPDDLKLFDHIALTLIRKAVNETGTEIVLSSTWRNSIGWDLLGKQLDLPIVDRTPSLLSGHRGREISGWLSCNKINKYVIIDDYDDMLEEQMKFFVKTDPHDGLRWGDYCRLMHLLGHKDYREKKYGTGEM